MTSQRTSIGAFAIDSELDDDDDDEDDELSSGTDFIFPPMLGSESNSPKLGSSSGSIFLLGSSLRQAVRFSRASIISIVFI